jgi:hypothetical protein
MACFGSEVQVRHGATCQRTMAPEIPTGFRTLQIS